MFRITGEPLFDHSLDGLAYSEQFGFANNAEGHATEAEASAMGFDIRSHTADYGTLLSAAMGNPQRMHGAPGLQPDESDEEDLSEEYDDIDEDDDEHLNGDDSSQGELDE